MIYLKLQNNKILKMNQSASVYTGENKADVIKIDIADVWEHLDCYLNILSSVAQQGDVIPISDGEEISLEQRFLTCEQDLLLWIEIRDGETILKSSEVKLRVNKHSTIESIITESEITAFEEALQKASLLNEETKQLKEDVESLLSQIPNIDELTIKIKEIEELRKELEESLAQIQNIPTKLSDLENDTNFVTSAELPTKLSDLTNDSNFVTLNEVPTKLSELENDANYLSPQNLTPEVVEALKVSLDQEVISF